MMRWPGRIRPHFADEIVEPKKAAEAVVAAADTANATGITLSAALEYLLHPLLMTSDDFIVAWKQTYARNALTIPSYVDLVLRRLPSVPALWHGEY
jgi:hypothetical protein